jgi:hypothetical protein
MALSSSTGNMLRPFLKTVPTRSSPIPGHTRITELASSIDLPMKEGGQIIHTITGISEERNPFLFSQAAALPRQVLPPAVHFQTVERIKTESRKNTENDPWHSDGTVKEPIWRSNTPYPMEIPATTNDEVARQELRVEDEQVDSHIEPVIEPVDTRPWLEGAPLEAMPMVPGNTGESAMEQIPIIEPITADSQEPELRVIDFNDKAQELQQARDGQQDETLNDHLYKSVHETVDIPTWLESVHPGSFPVEDTHNYDTSCEGSNIFHSRSIFVPKDKGL